MQSLQIFINEMSGDIKLWNPYWYLILKSLQVLMNENPTDIQFKYLQTFINEIPANIQ